VHEAVPREELEDHAVALAREIAGNAPLSLKGNKRIIRELLTFSRLSENLEREVVELRMSSFLSEDFREGVKAFGEKRKPRWQGR
jgi:enoyl-CoA hydratase/carnithine racemase